MEYTKFTITFVSSTDDELRASSAPKFVNIDGYKDGSCGFITVEDPADLFRLRREIDKFIITHGIQPPKHEKG